MTTPQTLITDQEIADTLAIPLYTIPDPNDPDMTIPDPVQVAEFARYRNAAISAGESERGYPHLDQTLRLTARWKSDATYFEIDSSEQFRLKSGSVGGIDCKYLIKGWPRTSISALEFRYFNSNTGALVSDGLAKVVVVGVIEYGVPVYAIQNNATDLPNALVDLSGYVTGTIRIGTGMMMADWTSYYNKPEFKAGMLLHVSAECYKEIRSDRDLDIPANLELAIKSFNEDPLRLER